MSNTAKNYHGTATDKDIIEDLRTAATAINDTATWLANLLSTEPPAAPAELQLTLVQVRAVLAEKSRAGHTAEIRTLLQKYGASKLSGIDPANYKALVTDVEVLGDGN